MSAIYPLTLYFDGACPVCALEMEHLRARDAEGRLAFVDISAPGFDAASLGTTHAALDAALNGRLADGRVLQGVPVLRLAYEAVGLGALWRPTAWGPLRPLADAGYRVFARHRRAISAAAAPLIDFIAERRARRGAQRLRACTDGTCQRDGGRS